MKKKKTSLIALLLVFVMLLAVPAQTFGAARASIKLDKKTLTVVAGRSAVLKATVTGASRKVVWKSSNIAVAQVSSSGRITAKKAGRVTISATANKKTAKCIVTVKKAPDYVKQGKYIKKYPLSAGFHWPACDYVYVQKLSNEKVKIKIVHVTADARRISSTNVITAKVVNNKAAFSWKNVAWRMSGKGVLTFGKTGVKLQMKNAESDNSNKWDWRDVTIPFSKKMSTVEVKKAFESV